MSAAGDMERARLRTEFEQLQREYRNMEATRKAYAEESLAVIRKQKEGIDKLTKDNEAVKTSFDIELRFLARGKSGDGGGSSGGGGGASHGLHTQLDLYIGKVEIEHRNIESLAKQVEILRAKVIKESKIIGGMNAAKEAERQLAKKVKVLENRLENALVRFNEALASNREARNVIDTLRQERSVFESVYAKLERELSEKKKLMAALIESSNQAYEARDVALMEAAKIQQESNAERVVFEQQLAAMDAAVDAEVDAARQKEVDMRGTLTMEEEDTLKKNLKIETKDVATAEQQARGYASRVEAFETSFSRIRDETGIEEVEELVQVFLKNEDANFALFNYVAEQSAELARLEEILTKLRSEAMGYEAGRRILDPLSANTGSGSSGSSAGGNTNKNASGATTSAASRGAQSVSASTSSSLALTTSAASSNNNNNALTTTSTSAAYPHLTASQNEQLAVLTSSIEKSMNKHREAKRITEAVRVALQSIVASSGADHLPGAELLLTDRLVTEGNMMKALGLVEQRANGLLAGYASLTRAAEEEARAAAAASDGNVNEDGEGSSGSGSGRAGARSRSTAATLMAEGPRNRSGADKLHPVLPAIADFSREPKRHDMGGVGNHDNNDDEDDEEDEDGIAHPMSLTEIKLQTQRSMAAAAARI